MSKITEALKCLRLVAGHSYGSFIALLAGGVTIDLGGGGNVSLAYGALLPESARR